MQLCLDTKMIADLTPVVAVPARNESQRLPHLLRALNDQLGWSASARVLPVVIVLNNTTDDSAGVIRDLICSLPKIDLHLVEVTFEPGAAHVGSARRLAMQTAATLVGSTGVLLTTDADAVPAPDWVLQNLRAIDKGADLVGGRIIGDPAEEALLGAGFQSRARKYASYAVLCDELAASLDPLPHDPWPRHQDHTGGSIAVRADVYQAIGGMPALPFREDVGFVSLALRANYRLVHPMDVAVTVSARTEGRAPGGMADCVKSWVADELAGKPILVERPQSVEQRLLLRQTIRSQQGVSPATIAVQLEEHAAADLDVVGSMPIDLAIQQVTQRLLELKGTLNAA
jgi:hypothetical protein